MKPYEKMIEFVADQVEHGHLRYQKWVAAILLAETYGVTQETVAEAINEELSYREKAKRERARAEHKASNEARRLANLARKENA